MTANVLRASVTSAALGLNYSPNPNLIADVDSYATDDWGGGDIPTLDWVSPDDLPDASPIGMGGAGFVGWVGPDTAGTKPPALVLDPGTLISGQQFTFSLYVWVPSDSVPVLLRVDDVQGEPSAFFDQWQRVSVTLTVGEATPETVCEPLDIVAAGQGFFFTGAMIAPGIDPPPFSLGGGQPGDAVQILVDGSDTPVTANGLAGYIPEPGDRLLVQRVGNVVEVLQFLSRGTVPYLTGDDLSDLAAQVDLNTTDIGSVASNQGNTAAALSDYMATTDGTLAGLQAGYDPLSGIGAAGVEEDYFWVGDDPALSTTKLVQISTYVQGGLFAGDHQTLADYFSMYTQDDIGDLDFTTADPPMSVFYKVFTDNGLTAEPWNG